MKSARAHLHVVGLENEAALLRPEILERKDEVLKGLRLVHEWPDVRRGRNLSARPRTNKLFRCIISVLAKLESPGPNLRTKLGASDD